MYHSSGGWEVQGLVKALFSWLTESCLFIVSSHGRNKGALWVLFSMGTNLEPLSSLKDPNSKYLHIGD